MKSSGDINLPSYILTVNPLNYTLYTFLKAQSKHNRESLEGSYTHGTRLFLSYEVVFNQMKQNIEKEHYVININICKGEM